MYLAYVDDSGGEKSQTLACVLIESSQWPDIFDNVIDFRRFLKSSYGVPVRAEVKANYLLYNKGAFRDLRLSERARFSIYRGFMRLQPKIGNLSFAVVIRKDKMAEQGRTEDPREVAWEYLIQRLERFTTKGNTEVVLIHDEGEGSLIRRLVRRARRIGTAGSAFGTGSLKRPARLIIDDPVSRKSDESYFVQIADLNAYAAFRRIYSPPERTIQIVPQGMWDELDDARFTPVSEFRGKIRGVSGVVVWP